MHPVLRLLSILAFFGASFAVIPTAHAAKRQVPFGFYGVMWDGDIATAPAKQQDRQWALMARSGVESVRTVFSWALAQPTADGPLDFTDTDRKVAMASRHGVALLPVVLYTPHWAARSPDTFGSTPKYASDYAAFMRQLVLRYGPRGSFWGENPKLPRRPIRDWQLWNEPHFDFYWHVPGADKTQWASEYVELLRQARPAIKQADPGARIVLAGLADASWRIMAGLYRAGVQGNFDVATVHIFTGRPGYVMTAVELVGRELKRHGEGRKPIWVTEATFPAGKGRVPLPPLEWQRQWYTTDRGMGTRLRELYSLGAERRSSLRLKRIYWVTWATTYSGNDLFHYSGLVRYRGVGAKPRPSLRAYRASARRHQGCAKTAAGSCVR
jgi:hypothetical protein